MEAMVLIETNASFLDASNSIQREPATPREVLLCNAEPQS